MVATHVWKGIMLFLSLQFLPFCFVEVWSPLQPLSWLCIAGGQLWPVPCDQDFRGASDLDFGGLQLPACETAP